MTGNLAIPGCVLLERAPFRDARGVFDKPFSDPAFAALGLPTRWAECFWTTSHRGVLRGFHLQLPPADHAKLVFVVSGEVHDVLVDLRVGSPAFGVPVPLRLAAGDGRAVCIPPGVAHAFQALTDAATLVYLVGTPHAPALDAGVHWDLAGSEWPIRPPQLSPRDGALPPLAAFRSPFCFADPGDGRA